MAKPSTWSTTAAKASASGCTRDSRALVIEDREILALEVAHGIDTPGENVTVSADVNGDDKIGMAEVIYIVQEVMGLR